MKSKINLLNKTGFTLILALFFIVQAFSISVFSRNLSVQFSVNLLNPIEFITQNKNLSESEREEILLSVKNISQIAYNAFIFDNPIQSMWMDINQSQISVKNTGTKHGDGYLWKITSIQNTIPSLPNYSNPKKMTETLKKAIENISVEGQTLLEKVRFIHNYVCNINTYDLNAPHAYSAYGALIDGRSVCEGYAEAIKLLCDQNGIESILVFGSGITSAGNDNHMWNYIKMDDGNWYALDATWDDGKKISESYFLVGYDTVVDSINNITFSQDHLPSENISEDSSKKFTLPELSSKSYLENNPDGAASSATLYAPYRYYYNQLNNEQKNYYNTLLSVMPPEVSEADPSTDTSSTTTDSSIPETTVSDTTESDDLTSIESSYQTSETKDSENTTKKGSSKNTTDIDTTKSKGTTSDDSSLTTYESDSTQKTEEPDPNIGKFDFNGILRISVIVVLLAVILTGLIFIVTKFTH